MKKDKINVQFTQSSGCFYSDLFCKFCTNLFILKMLTPKITSHRRSERAQVLMTCLKKDETKNKTQQQFKKNALQTAQSAF